MNSNFFRKQSFLFNYLSFILLYYDSKLIDVQYSIAHKKIFQNDEFDEREDDGEKICESSEKKYYITEDIP